MIAFYWVYLGRGRILRTCTNIQLKGNSLRGSDGFEKKEADHKPSNDFEDKT